MIDPEPVETPDDAEPTHVAIAEPVEVVEVLNDIIVTVEVDEFDDEEDDLEYMPGYLLLVGKSLEEMQHNLGLLARRLDPAFDAYLKQVEALVESVVKVLRSQLSDPEQFRP